VRLPILAIGIGDVVRINYTAKLEDGRVLAERESIKFRVGLNEVIQGLDEAVIGLSKGDKKRITVPPEKGYGLRKEGLTKEVPRETFKGLVPRKGMIVEFKSGKERKFATIADFNEETIILDLNHPLAGKTLIFEIEIVDA
jgi:FKBP-type peptidyl-prolyl cis-trans isomerase 2